MTLRDPCDTSGPCVPGGPCGPVVPEALMAPVAPGGPCDPVVPVALVTPVALLALRPLVALVAPRALVHNIKSSSCALD